MSKESVMDIGSVDVEELGRRLLNLSPVLHFLVRQEAPYAAGRIWGEFDQLHVRAIDDLSWDLSQEAAKTIVAFTTPPPCSADVTVVAVPMAVALERVFFHLQEIQRIEINPIAAPDGLPRAQTGVECSLPQKSDESVVIVRENIPELIGFFSVSSRTEGGLVDQAQAAFQQNLLFECFYLARKARRSGGEGLAKAWFLELWSFSFLGLPEEALQLYESYPDRGNPDPLALIVGARYRLLLKQFNEARTIFHTLAHHGDVAATAECELARSYIHSGDFSRAIDLASSSMKRDPSLVESYLVRGIAHRGVSYSSGDEEGLREALKDFEHVATKGGFHAPEASFHAGTVFARLGDLVSAEQSLRQSLFQRDRFSSRDALIRVLCAAGKWDDAREECALLAALAPHATAALTDELDRHAAQEAASKSSANESDSEVGSTKAAVACAAAGAKLRAWHVPVEGKCTDLLILDDFINRFAPAGEFVDEGQCSAVSREQGSLINRVMALHIAGVLAHEGLVAIEDPIGSKVRVVTRTEHATIDIEEIVEERVLLGAAGDNVSSLESLLVDAGAQEIPDAGAVLPSWWERAEASDIQIIQQLAEAGRARFIELGAVLSGGLSDLEELDRVINSTFEPGGKSDRFPEGADADTFSSFVVEAGLFVASIVERYVPVTWYRHQWPEGLSCFNVDLGRFFPVARFHRRVYLASAADYGIHLGSLALGVAAAAAAHKVRSGEYTDEEQVRTELLALLPSLSRFSEAELKAVVGALMQG